MQIINRLVLGNSFLTQINQAKFYINIFPFGQTLHPSEVDYKTFSFIEPGPVFRKMVNSNQVLTV